MNNKVLTFPSSHKSNCFGEIIKYIYQNNIQIGGQLILDKNFIDYLNISGVHTNLNNTVEYLEFFNLIEGNNNLYKLTELGYKVANQFGSSGIIDEILLIEIINNTTMPYKKGVYYKLKNDNYPILEVLLKLFYMHYVENKNIISKNFDEVFYFKINDENSFNFEELYDLIINNNEFTHKRTVIDYLFDHLVFFNILGKIKGKEEYYLNQKIIDNESFFNIISDNNKLIESFETFAKSNNSPNNYESKQIREIMYETVVAKRNISLRRETLKLSNYTCQIDSGHCTFLDKSNNNYMEAHHIIPVKNNLYQNKINYDSLENMISLCPNCHAKIHYGRPSEVIEMATKIYDIKRSDLISLDEKLIDFNYYLEKVIDKTK